MSLAIFPRILLINLTFFSSALAGELLHQAGGPWTSPRSLDTTISLHATSGNSVTFVNDPAVTFVDTFATEAFHDLMWDGTTYWGIGYYAANYIYELADDFSIVNTFPTPFSGWPSGIFSGQGHVWVTTYWGCAGGSEDCIVRYDDFPTSVANQQYDSPFFDPDYFCWDGTYYWATDVHPATQTLRLMKLNSAMQVLQTYDLTSAAPSVWQLIGVAYRAPHLYVSGFIEWDAGQIIRMTTDGQVVDVYDVDKALFGPIWDGTHFYASQYGWEVYRFDIDALTVHAPNGRENWEIGTTRLIEWTPSGSTAVDIFLVESGGSSSVIARGAPDVGSYLWSIPLGTNPGNYYRVRIESVDATNVSDESDDYFRLNEPAPTDMRQFVGRVGSQLHLDGEPFTYVGANAFRLLYDQKWNDHLGWVDQVLDAAVENGVGVLRMWLYGDGDGLVQTTPGVYDDDWFSAMDQVIAKCKARGIRLIPCLGNYYDAYGGIPQYIRWHDPSLVDTVQSQFYQIPEVRAWHKAFVQYAINRYNEVTGITYKNDPTIMAWEFMNEPKALGQAEFRCPTTPELDALYAWIADMAQFVREADGGRHLVGVGAEGSIRCDGDLTMGREYFQALYSDPNIDFCTQHLYPDGCHLQLPTLPMVENFVSERLTWSNVYVGKPLLIEEFGQETTSCICSDTEQCLDYYAYSRGELFEQVYEALYFSEGQGSNFWSFFPHDEDYADHGFNIYWDSHDILDVVAARAALVNHAVTVPTEFTITRSADGNHLSWAGTNKSYTHYRLHRSPVLDFVPDESNLLVSTMALSYHDTTGSGADYYKLMCVDASGNASPPVEPTETPVAAWSDVTPVQLSAVGGNHGGCAWGDYNNDGYDDLAIARKGQPNKLFMNEQNGGLVDVTDDVGGFSTAMDRQGSGVAWGDYDNDGNLDLYMAYDGQSNMLLWNTGGGTFVDRSATPVNDAGGGADATWVDYNNDGLVDLFLLNNMEPNHLFANSGNHVFTDVPHDFTGGGTVEFDVAWCDYDNDGDQDYFLCGPAIGWGTSTLVRNDGNGIFTESTGVAQLTNLYALGATWGDCDNDGKLDLFIAYNGPWYGNRLYRNLGNGSFTRVRNDVLDSVPGAVGASWADYDNDGDLDLYVAGSAGTLLRNEGDGQFADVTDAAMSVQGTGDWADYDKDGDLDLYIGYTSRLLRNNQEAGNHWLHVDLVGTVSNRAAIGARVRIVAAGVAQIREVTSGSSFLSQGSLTVEFGLGAATIVDTLQVTWPYQLNRGQYHTSILTNVEVDRVLELEEIYVPGVSGVENDMPSEFALLGCRPNPFNPATTIGFDLPRQSLVRLRVFDVSGRAIRDLVSAQSMAPGRYERLWDGKDDSGRGVPSGMYFYRLDADGFSDTKRMVLIK